MGLFYIGFSIFWTAQATTNRAPAFFSLFGAVLIAIGFYYVIGRFFVKVWRKRRSFYAVTDRRAFAVEGRTVRDTPIVGVGRTVTRSRQNRLVTVVFATGRSARWNLVGGGNQMPLNSGLDGFMSSGPMAFFDVPDGDGLLRALEHAESLQQRTR